MQIQVNTCLSGMERCICMYLCVGGLHNHHVCVSLPSSSSYVRNCLSSPSCGYSSLLRQQIGAQAFHCRWYPLAQMSHRLQKPSYENSCDGYRSRYFFNTIPNCVCTHMILVTLTRLYVKTRIPAFVFICKNMSLMQLIRCIADMREILQAHSATCICICMYTCASDFEFIRLYSLISY